MRHTPEHVSLSFGKGKVISRRLHSISIAFYNFVDSVDPEFSTQCSDRNYEFYNRAKPAVDNYDLLSSGHYSIRKQGKKHVFGFGFYCFDVYSLAELTRSCPQDTSEEELVSYALKRPSTVEIERGKNGERRFFVPTYYIDKRNHHFICNNEVIITRPIPPKEKHAR